MGYKILSKKEICPHQYEITIDAPYVVRNAKAGQFIIFRADENGERVPPTETLIRLADFYDASIDYILCRTNNPHIEK